MGGPGVKPQSGTDDGSERSPERTQPAVPAWGDITAMVSGVAAVAFAASWAYLDGVSKVLRFPVGNYLTLSIMCRSQQFGWLRPR
jgi:hypothetical protein